MNYYFDCLKKYAVFKGRSRRKEFWIFLIGNLIVELILSIIGSLSGNASGTIYIIVSLYQWAVVIPSIALAVRRMHDIGNNGWFAIVPIYNLIILFLKGTKGPNKYGPDPLAGSQEAAMSTPSQSL